MVWRHLSGPKTKAALDMYDTCIVYDNCCFHIYCQCKDWFQYGSEPVHLDRHRNFHYLPHRISGQILESKSSGLRRKRLIWSEASKFVWTRVGRISYSGIINCQGTMISLDVVFMLSRLIDWGCPELWYWFTIGLFTGCRKIETFFLHDFQRVTVIGLGLDKVNL